MSVVGEIYEREVNGAIRNVEYVTAFLGIYINPVNGFTYAVDWNGNHRAAFQRPQTSRDWCNDANKIYAGLPESTKQIMWFNERMKLLGWSVVQLLGDCQVWEKGAPLFDTTGRPRELAGAAS